MVFSSLKEDPNFNSPQHVLIQNKLQVLHSRRKNPSIQPVNILDYDMLVMVPGRRFFTPSVCYDDPDLCRNATKKKYKHKHRVEEEIKLHIINIKELKYAYIQNGSKLAWTMVAYL